MKVLYLTNIPSPYRVAFFNELGKICDLTVLYERQYAGDRDKAWLEAEAIHFTAHVLPGIGVGSDSGFCPTVLKWMNSKRFDIIVAGGYSTPTGMLAIYYMNLRKIPYIINVDGGMIKPDSSFKYRFKQSLLGHATAYLTTGQKSKEYLGHYGATAPIHLYPFTSLNEADLLPEPVSSQEKQCIRAELGMMEGKIILSVGQFIHRKGYDVLLRALPDVCSNVGVYLVGGSPTAEYLELVEQLGLQSVHFVEFMDKGALQKYYKAADLFVLPTREDIWGLVINEAMACGLPVITTKNCIAGCQLVEDGANGYLVDTEDSAALSTRMAELLSDELLRHQMAKESLRRIGAYTVEKMATSHMECFETLL